MKSYICILLLTGCASYPEYVGVDYPDQPNVPEQYVVTDCSASYDPYNPYQYYQVPTVQQSLAQSQIQASQMNQLVSGVFGPNQVSGALLTYQNYNRQVNAVSQNPWLGFFMLRNNWVK